jgi:hypothetical protein
METWWEHQKPATQAPAPSPLLLQISNTALVSYGTGKKLVVKPALTSIEVLKSQIE